MNLPKLFGGSKNLPLLHNYANRSEPGEIRQKHYIRSHTALRGVASILVVVYHLQFGGGPRLWVETATSFFSKCYLFVDLFFILSGFVIAHSFPSGEESFKQKSKVFYVLRFARIYPLHIFCLIYVFIIVLLENYIRVSTGKTVASESINFASFVQEALLVQAWIPGSPYWNVPSWSISAEVFAYLLFPFITLFDDRYKKLSILVSLSIPIVFYSYIAISTNNLDIIAGWAPIRCLSGFILGVYIFKIRHISEILSIQTISIVQIIVICLILILMAFDGGDVFLVPLFSMLILTTWEDKGVLADILTVKPAMFLGEISYSIYLNHVCLIVVTSIFWSKIYSRFHSFEQMLRILQIISYFIIIIVISNITYKYIEIYCKAKIMKFAGISRKGSLKQ